MAASLREYCEQYRLEVPITKGYWCRDIPFEQWLLDKIEALESFRKTAEQLNERLEPQVLAMRCALYDIAIKAAAVGHDEIAELATAALNKGDGEPILS
jgi:hypothetical protein